MGGCLDELKACEMSSDSMANMICKAVIDCCKMNNLNNTTCPTSPMCTTQLTALIGYTPDGGMAGSLAALSSAVGSCSAMKCAGACP
jgi:hypothetical protein